MRVRVFIDMFKFEDDQYVLQNKKDVGLDRD